MADMNKSDDLSLFLHQILFRSSSSPSSNTPTVVQSGSQSVHQILDPIPSSVEYFPMNLSSSSTGNVDNDVEEHEYESEEGGFEAMAEEAPAKTAPSRSSSKRSRAAEVHNLSEKRRRRRINEKMKALQNLIPNSNKTDKASMLDEAIEYLKQLQLQVQMLTMRNGLSLYPMGLSGLSDPTQLSSMNMGFLEGNGLLNIGLMGQPHMVQETPTNLPDQNTGPAHLRGPEMSTLIPSGNSLIPAQLHISSLVSDIFSEDVLPHRQPDEDLRHTNIVDFAPEELIPVTMSRNKD